MKKVQPLEKTSWTSIQNQVFLGPKEINFNEGFDFYELFIKECKSPNCRPWWD